MTGTTPTRVWRRALATPARKVGAALVTAVLAALATWLIDSATTTIEKARRGAPVRVTVLEPSAFFSAHPYAPYYVVPRKRIASPAKLTPEQHRTFLEDPHWPRRRGGVAASPQVVRLELRGTDDAPVVINAVRAEVVDLDAPVRGWFTASPGCGAEPIRLAAVDLDARPTRVRWFDDRGAERPARAFSVTRSDVELFEVHAATDRSTVRWRLVVSASTADGTTTVRVPERGTFEVSSIERSAGYRLAGFPRPRFVRERAWDDGIEAC